MEKNKEDFLGSFGNIARQLKGLSEQILPHYQDFTYNVENGRINDINTIERELDYMLSFCFDERVLVLYKRVLRKIYYTHPDIVKSYIDSYLDMYENDDDDDDKIKF